MEEFIGCGLVCVAFVLLRFFFTCPKNIWNRLSPTSQTIIFYSQQILYWGLLIVGLVLSFLSGIKLGLITLGCFLWIYKNSFLDFDSYIGFHTDFDYTFAHFHGIPLLANRIAGSVGFISLLLGLTLLFITSLKYGFIATGAVFLALQIVKYLSRIEWKLIGKQVLKDEKDKKPKAEQKQ